MWVISSSGRFSILKLKIQSPSFDLTEKNTNKNSGVTSNLATKPFIIFGVEMKLYCCPLIPPAEAKSHLESL